VLEEATILQQLVDERSVVVAQPAPQDEQFCALDRPSWVELEAAQTVDHGHYAVGCRRRARAGEQRAVHGQATAQVGGVLGQISEMRGRFADGKLISCQFWRLPPI
jgi:hypothetical protein